MTPEQRSLRAKIAANARWSKSDRHEGTKPARAGFLAKFERKVDPMGVLPPAERARRAESALRAHMATLALRSSMARGQPGNGAAPRLEGLGAGPSSQPTTSDEFDVTATSRRQSATTRREAAS